MLPHFCAFITEHDWKCARSSHYATSPTSPLCCHTSARTNARTIVSTRLPTPPYHFVRVNPGTPRRLKAPPLARTPRHLPPPTFAHSSLALSRPRQAVSSAPAGTHHSHPPRCTVEPTLAHALPPRPHTALSYERTSTRMHAELRVCVHIRARSLDQLCRSHPSIM